MRLTITGPSHPPPEPLHSAPPSYTTATFGEFQGLCILFVGLFLETPTPTASHFCHHTHTPASLSRRPPLSLVWLQW